MPRTGRGAITLAEDEPPTPRRRLLGRLLVLTLVVVLGLGAWFGIGSLRDSMTRSRCQATALGKSVDFDPEQMSNAATITAIALKRGLPARAATIAIATAIQESKLRNIQYGDRDSIGLFQQRPSQGWGTVEQILDPEYSTNAFYDALVKVKGYESMPITQVAQKVQRSAYPEAYADHEGEGRAIASALSGHSPGGLGCRIGAPEKPADVALITKQLTAEYALTAKASRSGGSSVLVIDAPSEQLAWSVGAWATAKSGLTGVTAVVVGDRQWTRSKSASAYEWQRATTPAGAATRVVLHLG
jgi:hypothetical protein